MKKPASHLLTLALLSALVLPGCVASKKYDDLKARQASTEQGKAEAERQHRTAVAELRKATDALAEMRLQNRRLADDSAQTGNALRRTRQLYTQLTDSYDKLLKNSDRELANKSSDYNKVAQDLARREAELGQLDAGLRKSRADIDKLNADLKTREARLAELEKALAEKDKAVNDLRASVANALRGFQGTDLQVKMKDGKVYVSLSEQLLFKTGSTKVDPKGQEALKQLATVLQQQPDVNVVVEGHTDNVPFSRPTAAMQDNWDLSVLRATEIARLLTTGGVQPDRVTASGRSQYVPVAQNDSPANKALNRRTEIILTPKLNELLKILDSNSAAPGK
ncbi:OmpA family protein [Hymenobacter psychrotolerans]|uniref:Chemotaxis protein MotB n=1 Tax=Hymenobacter psychrotolerans DSM 18569 TaxID=1121959 RepID=A0A1M6S2L6_9BACT|nr:OmpA family protein [Hymenobacter psychrotolerans]SHK39064.1 chemotaxis protein MotB [Hymenobacter psychrotolerans DSM 18569]